MAKPHLRRPKDLPQRITVIQKQAKRKKLPPMPQMPPDLAIELQQKSTAAQMAVEFTKPEQSAQAVWLRAQGMTYKRIEAATGLKFDTIRGLCWRHEETLESKKKEFSRRYAQIAEMAGDALSEKMERMLENPEQLDAISPDRLALTIGIMTDHAAKLSGMAGVVIEHRKGASISDAADAIAAARQRIADKVRAESIEAVIIS